MKTYAIRVTETLSKTVLVEAGDLVEAIKLIEEAHTDGKITLDYDDYDGVEVGASPYWLEGIFTGTKEQRELFHEI